MLEEEGGADLVPGSALKNSSPGPSVVGDGGRATFTCLL